MRLRRPPARARWPLSGAWPTVVSVAQSPPAGVGGGQGTRGGTCTSSTGPHHPTCSLARKVPERLQEAWKYLGGFFLCRGNIESRKSGWALDEPVAFAVLEHDPQ